MDRVTNIRRPIIPNNIIVHLGRPQEAARNISVPFIDYIKNVASSEIFPNWPDEAIRANVLAQISFALNRIYNEWYPSQGYNYDITNLSGYDQTYIEDREIYEKTSRLVDNIFNDYIIRDNQVQPLYAQYCDGKYTDCEGLSQWGSVSLANNGKNAEEILKYYYGNDIDIVQNAPLSENIPSYPGFSLILGSAGDDVLVIEKELNRIAQNYPEIPTIKNVNQFYTVETENAVRAFQEIFDLGITGIVDKATWYKIKYIYNAVKKIADIYSEGISVEEATKLYGNELKYLDSGQPIRVLHYFLQLIAYLDPDIPFLNVSTSIFDNNTREMVIAFQKKYGLSTTGIVDRKTWAKLIEVYERTINNLPEEYLQYSDEIFPGIFLTLGMKGENVLRLQRFLLKICRNQGIIPGVRVNGTFDELTESSVKKIQDISGLIIDGAVGPVTWNEIVKLSKK